MNDLRDEPFALIGVHVGGKSAEELRALMEREDLPWRTFVDPGQAAAGPIATSWNSPSTPTFFVIDAAGVIRHKWVGQVDPEVVDAAIATLIQEAKAAGRAAQATPSRDAGRPGRLVPDGGPIGTEHPFVLEAVDPSGRWAILCQAREDSDHDGRIEVRVGHHGDLRGDDMLAYLVWGEGAGEPIDAFVDASPTGDHFALIRTGRLLLVDADARAGVDLTAAGADSRWQDDGVRWCVAFDPSGQRAAWVRGMDREAEVVVRDLATAREIVVDLEGALVVSFGFDATGEWLWLELVREDTNGDGVLEKPVTKTNLAPGGCRGSPLSYSTWNTGGDRPVVRIAPVSSGAPLLEYSPLPALTRGRLVKDPDGSLWLAPIDGDRELVSGKEDGAIVLSFSPSLDRALIVSMDVERFGEARIIGGEHPIAVDVRLSPRSTDPVPRAERYAIVLDADRGSMLIDFVDGTSHVVEGRFVGIWDKRILAVEGDALVLTDRANGERMVLAGPADHPSNGDLQYEYCRRAGPIVVSNRWVIDLRRAIAATCQGNVVGIDPEGRVQLFPRSADSEGAIDDWEYRRTLPNGPLRWHRIEPADPDRNH